AESLAALNSYPECYDTLDQSSLRQLADWKPKVEALRAEIKLARAEGELAGLTQRVTTLENQKPLILKESSFTEVRDVLASTYLLKEEPEYAPKVAELVARWDERRELSHYSEYQAKLDTLKGDANAAALIKEIDDTEAVYKGWKQERKRA